MEPDRQGATQLVITEDQRARWWRALAEFPLEACGLLVGSTDGVVESFHPTGNLAASSKLYTVAPADMLRVDRASGGRAWR
ncbi:MAG: hypothetical protein R2716_01160 [Microthrixaceae bacterium]